MASYIHTSPQNVVVNGQSNGKARHEGQGNGSEEKSNLGGGWENRAQCQAEPSGLEECRIAKTFNPFSISGVSHMSKAVQRGW